MAAPVPTIAVNAGGLITFKSLTSNVAEITTTTAHGLIVGDIVTIANEGAPFNGTGLVITAVPSTTKFRFAKTNANVTETAGAGTGTVTPTTVILTEDRPTVTLNAVESGSHSPAATARDWRQGTTSSGKTTASATLVIRRSLGASGAAANTNINCLVTNGDAGGPVASSNVVVSVADAIAAAYVPTTLDGTSRVSPIALPKEYRDPTVATSGLPTAAELAAAKAYGTVLPSASQLLALS